MLTTWVNNPEGTVFAVASALGAGDSAMDVTGESAPVDSPVVVEVWCSQATADRLEAQGEIILSSEVVPDEPI